MGKDVRQKRERNKLAPYLQEASDSDDDDDHELEAEDIAGGDLNFGSAIMATQVEPTPP